MFTLKRKDAVTCVTKKRYVCDAPKKVLFPCPELVESIKLSYKLFPITKLSRFPRFRTVNSIHLVSFFLTLSVQKQKPFYYPKTQNFQKYEFFLNFSKIFHNTGMILCAFDKTHKGWYLVIIWKIN